MERGPYAGPMRFAHRGLAQAAPENTAGAFQAAAEGGFEGMEIDVQRTRDGEIVVAHDANLTRMTLGHPTGFSNRRLAESTWEELSRAELPYANHLLPRSLPPCAGDEVLALLPERVLGQEEGSDYAAALAADGRMAHLMRFADFDAWYTEHGRGTVVEIEVKASGLMGRMLEILDRSPNTGHYILFSGAESCVREIQAACREGKPAGLRLGANIRFPTEEKLRAVREMDLFEVGLNARAFAADDVRRLADLGVAVLSNLGDDPAWWESLCRTGALGFKTNYAQAFTDWWYAREGRERD